MVGDLFSEIRGVFAHAASENKGVEPSECWEVGANDFSCLIG